MLIRTYGPCHEKSCLRTDISLVYMYIFELCGQQAMKVLQTTDSFSPHCWQVAQTDFLMTRHI